MDNTPKTESISTIFKNINDNDIVLPEFQRDFVWDIVKTYDLFDSLVKDIFIGSVIYGIPSFEITVREIDNRPRKGDGSRKKLKITSYSIDNIESKVKTGNFRVLLDGQQRLTSIYRALKGIDEVWFICKKEEELPTDIDFNKLSLEEILYEFEGQEDDSRLSLKISDAYEIIESGLFESEIRSKYFDPLLYLSNKGEEERIIIFKKFLLLCRKLNELLKAEKLLSYYLLKTNSEKFALFFERSNSKGIQLDFIDILAAKLYVGFNLRDKIEEFEDNNPNYILNREIIVRTIAYIVNEGKDIDRSSILAKLNYTHFLEHWGKVCNAYKNTIDFLFKNHFILSQSWMPYENMLIPLMIFSINIGEDFSQMNERQFDFIKYWYWASIFSQRYTSSSNEMIIQDARVLESIRENKKINEKSYFMKLRSLVTTSEDLISYSKKGSVIYKGVLNLINYTSEGLSDWKNSSKLGFNSKLEDHHIFPKEFLQTKYKDEIVPSEIDTVVNRTLIPKITNIKIGKKAPSVYLAEINKDNPKLDESLITHLIPVEIFQKEHDDKYDSFKQKRAEIIFKIIDEYVIKKKDDIIAEYYEESKRESSETTVSDNKGNRYTGKAISRNNPSIYPSEKLSLCKNNTERLNKRLETVLQNLVTDPKYVGYQTNWKSYFIETGLDEIWMVIFKVIPKPKENDFIIRVSFFFGDTMNQSKSFYKKNIPFSNFEDMVKKGWSLRTDFHISFMSKHLIWFPTDSSRYEKYYEYWINHQDEIKQYTKEDFLKFHHKIVELAIINDAEEDNALYNKFINTNRNFVYVCPAVCLSTDVKSDISIELDEVGRLEDYLKQIFIDGLQVINENPKTIKTN